MNRQADRSPGIDRGVIAGAIRSSFLKLDPRTQLRNPVMFAVYLGSILTTLIWLKSLGGASGESPGFVFGVGLWLWFTVLFANFAEAIAEGHGKAQAASLRKARTQVNARLIKDRAAGTTTEVPAPELKVGDLVRVQAGEVIPADGDVVEGVASVDESAITGESTRSCGRAAATEAPSRVAPGSSPTG